MSDSFATPWTVICQAPLSMGFPRKEYWSGLSFPSPVDLPDSEIKLASPALTGRFFTTEPPAKSKLREFGCCSVAQSCPTLCNPMDCSMPGFPVLHHFPEFPQTHVHWVSDTIQPSHPLLSPFPPAFNLSQH